MVLIQPTSAASVTSAVNLCATTVPRAALVAQGQGYTADSAAGQDVDDRDKPGQARARSFGDKLDGKNNDVRGSSIITTAETLARAMVD